MVGDEHPSRVNHVPEWSLLQIIEQYALLGGAHIRFTGGEPLLHPAWLRAMQFAATLGIGTITLQTNAMLMTEWHVSKLRLSALPGLRIEISLDGATAASHDRVRGAGSFAGTIQAVRRLIQGGFADRITISFTEMNHNLEEFPQLLQLAEELGLAGVIAGTLIQAGRAAKATDIAPPDSDQYLQLIQRYEHDQVFQQRYEAFGSMAALNWHLGDSPRSSCCRFAVHPYLTADGRLFPCLMCHSEQYAVSGVYEKGLAVALQEGVRVWAPLLEISRRRFAALDQCRDCPGADLCAGGCMGRALSSCGSPWAADDRCRQRRTIYTALTPAIK
jgi:radical SAM protein with 4Fe4S-binding SPASM domain